MNRLLGPGQPGTPRPGARPAMRTGTGIFLITAGAVLVFALRAGSPHWLNLQIVGVILILAGALGMLLPRLARARLQPDRLRRSVRPGQPRDLGAPAGADPGHNGDQPALTPDTSAPTLVDDLLSYEHPLL